MRCSHFLPTVCLYWANSHEVHKCKTDSWVTAVIVGAVGKKGEQPRTKSYDNCNVRFSFHKICQLNLNRVFSNHYYIIIFPTMTTEVQIIKKILNLLL